VVHQDIKAPGRPGGMALRLHPQDWVAVLRRLPSETHQALADAVPAAMEAQWLWAEEVKMLAKLVTFADGEMVAVTTPCEQGYCINGSYVPRRFFVHAFAEVFEKYPAHQLTSMLAFDQETGRSVPLSSRAALVGGTMVGWPGSRLVTPVHAAILHARLYVCMRLGLPKRQRGRRAARWSKIDGVGA